MPTAPTTRKQALDFAEALRRARRHLVRGAGVERRSRGPAPAARPGAGGMEVAAGEYGYDPFYFRRMLDAGAVDVLQADATRCGGITGFLRAAALADAAIRPAVRPHRAGPAPARLLRRAAPAHIEWFHDHVRIEQMLFDGAPRPARRPHRARPVTARPRPRIQAARRRAAGRLNRMTPIMAYIDIDTSARDAQSTAPQRTHGRRAIQPMPGDAASAGRSPSPARSRGEVRFDAGSRALYATDASNYRQVPLGVVVPQDARRRRSPPSPTAASSAPPWSRAAAAPASPARAATPPCSSISPNTCTDCIDLDPEARRGARRAGLRSRPSARCRRGART